MKLFRKILFFFLLGCITQQANSQIRKDSTPGRFLFLATPTAGYQPETRLSFGVVMFSTIKTGDAPVNTRLSNLELDILYTLNKQLIIDLDHHLYLADNNLIAAGSNSMYRYPELFYGIGPETDDSEVERYHTNRIELDNSFLFRIRPDLYGGLIQRFQQLRNLDFQEDSRMIRDQITGIDGGITNGLGLGFIYDERSNLINPQPGRSFLELSWMNFSKPFGSAYSFNRFEIDARHYFKTNDKGLLAVQAYGLLNTGDPPFRMTGMLGGSRLMRGYYQGRYRDRQYLVVQTEYRTRVYKRLGIVVFGGLGNVGNTLSGLFSTLPKHSFGAGLRFQIDKENNGNIRIDFALGEKSNGIYLSYGECF